MFLHHYQHHPLSVLTIETLVCEYFLPSETIGTAQFFFVVQDNWTVNTITFRLREGTSDVFYILVVQNFSATVTLSHRYGSAEISYHKDYDSEWLLLYFYGVTKIFSMKICSFHEIYIWFICVCTDF